MKKVLAVALGIIGVLGIVGGVITKTKKAVSVSVIGGADGPTSIFLAGKVGKDIANVLIVGGILLLVALFVVWFKGHKR